MARSLRERVFQWYGALRYDASTLPIKVIANTVQNVVESHFPVAAEKLIANPEMFLAWADRMSEEAQKLTQV
jgi:hypothetical protein